MNLYLLHIICILEGIVLWGFIHWITLFGHVQQRCVEECRIQNQDMEFIVISIILLLIVAASDVHHDFAMIKYARAGKAIPREKVVRLDNDNLVSDFVIITVLLE